MLAMSAVRNAPIVKKRPHFTVRSLCAAKLNTAASDNASVKAKLITPTKAVPPKTDFHVYFCCSYFDGHLISNLSDSKAASLYRPMATI